MNRIFLSGFCVELDVVAPTGILKSQAKKDSGVKILSPSLVPHVQILAIQKTLGKQSRIFRVSGSKVIPPQSFSLRPVQGTDREGRRAGRKREPVLNNDGSAPHNNSFWFTGHFHRHYLI